MATDNPFDSLPSRTQPVDVDNPFDDLPSASPSLSSVGRPASGIDAALRSVGLGSAFEQPRSVVPELEVVDDPGELARRGFAYDQQQRDDAIRQRTAAALNPPTWQDDLRSFGASEWEGLGAIARGVGGAWQLGYNKLLGEPLSYVTDSDQVAGNPFGDLADTIAGVGQRQRQKTSAGYQQLRRDNEVTGELFSPSTWSMGEDPSVRGAVANGVDVLGSLAPVLAGTILSGGSATIGAGVGGAQGGGAAVEQAGQALDQLRQGGTLAAESAVYRSLLEQGVPEAQAYAETKRRAEEWAFSLTAPISALGGAATARITSPASSLLAGRSLPTRVLGGAALSGAEEAAQETAEGVATRFGVNQGAGTDLDLMAGTFGDAVLGFMGGTGPGAAGAAARTGTASARALPAGASSDTTVPTSDAAANADNPFDSLPAATPTAAPARSIAAAADLDPLDALLLASEQRAAQQLQGEQPAPAPQGAVSGGAAVAPAPVGTVSLPAPAANDPIAEEDRRRWQPSARKDSKGRATLEPVLDFGRDGLLEWLGAQGGVDFEALRSQGGADPALLGDPAVMRPFGRVGWPALRRAGGMDLETLRERMQEAGWLPPDSDTDPSSVGINDALDLAMEAINGRPVLHPTQGQERRSDRQLKTMRESEEARDAELARDEGFATVADMYAAMEEADQRQDGKGFSSDDYQEALSLEELGERLVDAGFGLSEAEIGRIISQAGGDPAAQATALWREIQRKEADYGAVNGTEGQGRDARYASEEDARLGRVSEEQQSLFAKPTAREEVDAARRTKSAKRDGRDTTGLREPATTDGDLLDGARPEQLRIRESGDAVPRYVKRGFNEYLVDRAGEPRDFVTYGAARAEADRIGANVLVDDPAEGQRPTWSVVREEPNARVEQTAYHGTPHTVDRFTLQKIGTGEGAQAYGWGMYFAGRKEVAEWYRKGLSSRDLINKARNAYDEFTDPADAIEALREEGINERQAELLDALREDDWLGFDYPHQALAAALREPDNFELSDRTKAALANQGNLYQVDIPEDSDLLDYDKPLSEQSEKVQNAIDDMIRAGFPRTQIEYIEQNWDTLTGAKLYKLAEDIDLDVILNSSGFFSEDARSEAAQITSLAFGQFGIPGLRYLDGSSRSKGDGTHNYVIWDEGAVSEPESADRSVRASNRDMFTPTRGDRGAGGPDGRSDQTRNRREDADSRPAGSGGLDTSGLRPRPDGTPSVLRRRERALESYVRRFGGSLLGGTIADSFERTETAQLIEQTVASDEDLAALASIYRDPEFETLRYVFVNDANIVVGESAVTSRMAASSAAFPMEKGGIEWLKTTGQNVGATGVWAIHNHPSGDPTPSTADLTFTGALATQLKTKQTGLKLLGHVVLNHSIYTHIKPDGTYVASKKLRVSELADPLVDVRGVIAGRKITAPDVAASLGAEAFGLAPAESLAVMVVDSRNQVTVAATLPVSVMQTKRGAALVSAISKRGRASFVVLAGEAGQVKANMPGLVRLNELGLAMDVIAIEPDGSTTSVHLARTKGGSRWHNRGFADRKSGSIQRRSESGYQVYEPGTQVPFAQQVKERLASGNDRGANLTMGKTPASLRMLGFADVPMEMPPSVLFKLAGGKGGSRGLLTERQIARLAEEIDEPAAVFRSNPTSSDPGALVVATNIKDSAGMPVIVAVTQSKPPAGNPRLVVTVLTSAYGKSESGWFEREAREGRALYADENKAIGRLVSSALTLKSQGEPSAQRPQGGTLLGPDDIRKFRQSARSQSFRVEAPAASYSVAQTDALRKAGLATDEKTGLEAITDKLAESWQAAVELKSKSAADGRRQSAVDRFHGLRAAEGEVPFEKSAYIAARMSTGLGSMMEAILLYGAPELVDGVMSIKKGSKGLAEALEPVRKDIRDWLGWMVGRRAKLLKSQGRENNLSDADIDALLSLNKGREAAFTQAATDYAKLKTAILDVAEESGLIDPVGRAAWDHAEYVPFYREEQGDTIGPGTRKGLAGQTSGIRALKGADASLADPLANIIRNFTKLMDASLKNRASLLAIDGIGAPIFTKAPHEAKPASIPLDQVKRHLKEQGVSQQNIDALPTGALEGIKRMMQITPPSGEDVVRVMRDGKAEYYKVADPLVLRALTAFKQPQIHAAIKPLVWAKHLLTAGVTTTAEFVAANVIRDTGSTWLFTDQPVRHLLRVAKGAIQTIRRDATTRDLMMAGSSFIGGQYYSGRPEEVAKHLRRALTAKGLKGKPLEDHLKTIAYSPALLWRGWLRFSEAVENSNRAALYEAGRATGKGKLQAAYESKDLMDFSMRGDSQIVQFFADVLPFFNARLQGLYKVGRETRAKPKQILMRGAVMALASTALMAWNLLHYKDEYDELEEWDKDAYWHIAPGTEYHIRIPKPFELGIVFGTLPERFLNTAFGDATGGEAAKSFFHNFAGTLAMNPVPQAMMPIAEQWANKKFFTGGPIESMRDARMRPEDRTEWYTSDTMKEVGKATGLSPKRLEHLWKGYTAGLGGYVLETSDWITRKLNDSPELPELSLRDYPAIGRFARGDTPAMSTKYITEFYDLLEDAQQAEQSMKSAMIEGKVERAKALQEEWGWLFGAGASSKTAKAGVTYAGMKELIRVRDDMAGARKAIEATVENRTLTPEQKRAEVDRITERRNQRVEDFIKKTREQQKQFRKAA